MRGYERRIIYMKNVGSDYFDEAYFVVKSDTPPTENKKDRLVDEANRIIKENFKKKKRGKIPPILLFLLSFSLGVIAACVALFIL